MLRCSSALLKRPNAGGLSNEQHRCSRRDGRIRPSGCAERGTRGTLQSKPSAELRSAGWTHSSAATWYVDMTRLGLIAGNGKFPFLVLDAARTQGYEVVVAAIKEETSPEIDSRGAASVHWPSLGEWSSLFA